MTLLEKDLAFFMRKHKRFSLKTVLMLAQQLLNLLEEIHKKGYVHRDIKPENILVGKGANSHIVYFVDFGISKAFRDSNNKHIPMRKNKPFIGIFPFFSTNVEKAPLGMPVYHLIKESNYRERTIWRL